MSYMEGLEDVCNTTSEYESGLYIQRNLRTVDRLSFS
jgi:hypothetical protein